MNSIHKVFLLVACFTVFFTLVKSHSYVECADWRFNNPNSFGWAEDQGTCHGYARKWPRGQYPNVKFGMFDDIWEGYKDQGQLTYSTAKNPDTQPACHPDFQTRTNPITNSYAPANSNYGAMVQATSGQQLCWLWSGRNHADNGETCVDRSGILCPVYINMATVAQNDESQSQLSMENIAKITFSNCTRNDARYNNANRPCGGCFNLPQRSPGIYTVQWRWALNHDSKSGYDEVYTTCVDVQITGNSQTPTSQAQQTSRAQTSQAQQTSRAQTSQAQQTSRAQTSQAQQTSRAQTSRQQTSQQTTTQRTRTSASSSASETSDSDTYSTSDEVSQTNSPNPPSSDNNVLYDFADAYVRGGDLADDNYGLDPTLRVKYAADPNFARESYLSFDFFEVSQPVESCTLQLNQLIENGLDFNFDFQIGAQLGSTWSEEGITYNNKPTMTETISVNKELGQSQLNIDITDFCNQAISAKEIITLRLYKTGGSDVDQLVLHSKESAASDMIPKILLNSMSTTAVTSPEDSSASLLSVFPMVMAFIALVLLM